MEIQNKKEKYAMRLTPCSMYDFERMASWLQDMAQNGYILYKMIFNIALFKRGESQKIRYRLSELPYETLYNDRSPSNEEEMIAICEAGGWKYITRCGFFGVFATENETIPELNTDVHIQYNKYLGYLGCLFLLTCMIVAKDLDFLQLNGIFIGLTLVVLLISFKWGNHIPRSICLPFLLLPLSGLWGLYARHGALITWINEGSDIFLPAILQAVFLTFLIFYAFVGPLKFLLRILF